MSSTRSLRAPPGAIVRRSLTATLLLVAGVSRAETAALSSYTVQSYTTRDGLASNFVTSLVEDRRGFLWLGTPEGLIRFDGVELVTFDRRSTPSFRSHNVAAIVEDPKGFLWLGTGGGGLQRFVDERAETVAGPERLPNSEVIALHTRRNELWLGSRAGVCRLRGGALECFGSAQGLPSNWIGGYVGAPCAQSLETDASGRLWVTTSEGLAVLQGSRFVPVPLAGDEHVVAMRRAADGTLWAGTTRGRIGTLDVNGFVPVIDAAGGAPISVLLPTSRDAVWFGTIGRGLGRWDGSRVERLTQREGLPSDNVSTLLLGREGALWVGTQLGLVRLTAAPISQYGRRHGLLGALVVSVAGGRDGLWTVTDEGGLQRFDGERFEPPVGDAAELRAKELRRVSESRDGTVWLGTRRGLYRYRGGRVEPVGSPVDGHPVNATFEDSKGNLWVGTQNEGLHRLGPDGWRSWGEKDGLPDRGVYTVAEGRDGSIWVGTRRGLGRFDGNAMTAFRIEDGLPDPLVVSLHADRGGGVWLGGVSGGLIHFDGKRFGAVTEENGLPDNTVWSILEDSTEHFWLSSNRGINRVSRAEALAVARGEKSRLTADRYGPSEGLVEPDCTGGFLSAAALSREGWFCFATSGGVAVVRDPPHAAANPEPPHVQLLSAIVDGVLFGTEAPLTLPAGSRRLEVRFSAPTFISPDRVRFRRRLTGFEDPWQEIGGRREAIYTNLPPGRLTLELTASRDGQTWSSVARLPVLVEPRWYQTGLFQGAAIVLLLFVGPGFHRVRLLQAERRARALESVVADRTEELRRANASLEEKNVQLADLAVRDPLTGLANRRRFDEMLAEEWRRAARAGGWVSLAIADIDAFKQLNDTLGHPAGDACLKELGQVLLRSASRAGELAARIGGEEFGALLPDTPPDAALVVAERLRREVAKLSHPHPSSPVSDVVTVSVGVASARPVNSSIPSELVRAADEALYEAKRGGRNRTVNRIVVG